MHAWFTNDVLTVFLDVLLITLSGHRLDLRLDIIRAQQVPEVSALSHVQTAPVFSPPKTPKVCIQIRKP